jgi:hypothetical protein
VDEVGTVITLPIGSPCDFTSQCVDGSYCGDGHVCRKNSCKHNYECAKGEICHVGRVDGQLLLRNACFPFTAEPKSLDYCPGGGKPILNSGGFAETCDLDVACMGKAICNPIYGICCSSKLIQRASIIKCLELRACPFPHQPVLETETHRPLICQLRGSRQLECPTDRLVFKKEVITFSVNARRQLAFVAQMKNQPPFVTL